MSFTFIRHQNGRVKISDGTKTTAVNPTKYDLTNEGDGIWLSVAGDADKQDLPFMPINRRFNHDDIDYDNCIPAPTVTPTDNQQAFDYLLDDFFLT